MQTKFLHITNGDSLTERIQQLNISGKRITWREMLCEGPSLGNLTDKAFIALRKKFLKTNYQISGADYQKNFVEEFERLSKANGYDAVLLWFEFDLFCHINMLAVISYLKKNKPEKPIYLVCSKRLKGEKKLTGLSQLTDKELANHYKHKIHLTPEDIELADLIWQLYCEKNPMKLKAEIKKTSNFEYLSSCIRAHIERFPNIKTGLNALETNILRLIENHDIKNADQLLGYALEYQGYYGYEDLQMQRVIKNLKSFFSLKKGQYTLTEDGKQALNKTKNFYQKLKNDLYYGGVGKYDFLYNPESHTLLKL